MTIFQKTFIALALITAIGAGTYEAHQTSQWREQVQAIEQQQSPLAAQILQLQRLRDEATNRLASLLAENGQLQSESGSHAAELLQLRAEAARLKAAGVQTDNSPADSAVISWVNRVNQLKQYAGQHPDEGIPEFQFLTDREWLLIAAPDLAETGYDHVMRDLRMQAEPRFAQVVQSVLQKYSDANNGQFPTSLSQLQPYCDANVENILQQRYEIKPANLVNGLNIKTDWIIAGKDPIASGSADHIAIYTNGYSFIW